jgi:integrase
LSAFVKARAQHLGRRSLATEVSHLRSFVRFLSMQGLVAADLLEHARTLRFAKEHRLPPVWPPQAVEALLAAVDRSSAQGKRDYAILLLACRLGLRATDIRSLRLDEICWSGACIQFAQRKTGRPLSLPIDDEIGEALIDYLQHGRPSVGHREVFLKARAPHEPFGPGNPLHSVVASALQRAGIELPAGLPRGLHALRHTLATRLVYAGVPLETVADVLGHHSVESTRVYTHLDVEALRCVALDPEEVPRG